MGVRTFIQTISSFSRENYGIHGNASCLQDFCLCGSPTSRVMSSVHINRRRYIDILWLKGRTYSGETWYLDSIGVPHRFGEKKKATKQPLSDKIARNEKLQIAP